MRRYWIVLVFVLVFALCSCSPSPSDTDNSLNPPPLVTQDLATSTPPSTPSLEPPKQILPRWTTQGESTPMASALPTPYATGLQSQIEKAKQDLASRLSIPAAEIRVAEALEVTWPDSSLGCPKMGVMYIQVVTPGYQIALETSGKKYTYHTDENDRVLFCPGLQSGREITLTP